MMGQILYIHSDNPQPRLIRQAAVILRQGGIGVYPTDAAYALGCQIGEKNAQDRIRQLRQLDPQHHFTLLCSDLSQLASYAKVDNPTFRLLKAYTPGAYTFILPATNEVPRRLQHPKRKTIGLRIPQHPVTQALLAELGQPLLSVTLILPGDEHSLTAPEEISERLQSQVDLIILSGAGEMTPTTVIDLVSGTPLVIREGKGDVAPFQG
jgi:tRNA threonylcarbamoyl adenosine modification protein (Sua5/YciO/YrdC/YwlC family)